jgi:hypothetical protein
LTIRPFNALRLHVFGASAPHVYSFIACLLAIGLLFILSPQAWAANRYGVVYLINQTEATIPYIYKVGKDGTWQEQQLGPGGLTLTSVQAGGSTSNTTCDAMQRSGRGANTASSMRFDTIEAIVATLISRTLINRCVIIYQTSRSVRQTSAFVCSQAGGGSWLRTSRGLPGIHGQDLLVLAQFPRNLGRTGMAFS